MHALVDQLPFVLAQVVDVATSAGAETASPWIEWLHQYGAWFIFCAFVVCGVGLHISEDFLLIPAGVAIHEGHLEWTEVLLAAYFGLVLGDTLWILVCRTFGTRLVHSKKFLRMMGPRRLLEAKYAMEERGVIVLILARFIPGTRTPVLTMTGILHMPWWKFLAVELTTVAITSPIQVGVGYIGAMGFARAKGFGDMLTIGLASVAVCVSLTFGVHWWKQAKARKGPRPRSPVSWLRTFGRTRTAMPR